MEVTDGAPGLIGEADPLLVVTTNSGRTRVESGPAGTHRPTTRRGSAIGAPGRRPIASRAGA